MRLGVVCDLIAIFNDQLRYFRVSLYVSSDDEERALYIVFRQDFQYPGCPQSIRPIVEGEGNIPFCGRPSCDNAPTKREIRYAKIQGHQTGEHSKGE